MKPAPAEILRLRTVTSKSVGAPSFVGSSVQAVLSLSYTDRAVAEAECFKLFCLFLCICCKNHFLATVYFLYNLVQLILDRSFQFVCVSKVVWFLYEAKYFFSKFDSAFSAFCPYFGKGYIYAKFFTFCFYKIKLCLCICRECIDSNYAWQFVNILDVGYMFQKVWETFLKCFQVFIVKVSFCNTAVVFQGTYSSYDNNCLALSLPYGI